MSKITENNSIKRLQNKYRLVVMNDDTFEEVVTFKLSRVSVYIGLSTLFVVMVLFTSLLIVFTPLKYYIPGFGNQKSITQLQLLKTRTDSLELAIKYNEQFYTGIKNAINGQTVALDTSKLVEQTPTNSNLEKTKKRNKNEDNNEPKHKKRRHKRND
jgi:hypothetical protein